MKKENTEIKCNLNEHCVLGFNHNSPYCKIPINEKTKNIDIILKKDDKIFKKKLSKFRNLEVGDVIFLNINKKKERISTIRQ